MSLIQRAREFFRGPDSSLCCPRCEEPLDGHDEAACARRMSRRFFFQTLAGGVVAAAAVPTLSRLDLLIGTAPFRPQISGNVFITPEMIVRESLKVLNESLTFARWQDNILNGRLDLMRMSHPQKIGDTIYVRLPRPFQA